MRVIVLVCVSICVPPLSLCACAIECGKQKKEASVHFMCALIFYELHVECTTDMVRVPLPHVAQCTWEYLPGASWSALPALPACLICCRLPRLWQVAGRQGSKW